MEYMTIPKLAHKLELSDNTVRRYTKNYRKFFQGKMLNGWEQFALEPSLDLIRRINAISRAGKRRADVEAELKIEFEIIEVKKPKVEEDPGVGVDRETKELLSRIASALEKIAENGGVANRV